MNYLIDPLSNKVKGARFTLPEAQGLLAGLGVVILLVSMVTGLFGGRFGLEKLPFPAARGREAANADGNPTGLARILFGQYVFAFELTGALLITAALGAIMLTHRERLVPRVTQKTLSKRRVFENAHVAGLPAPGVFARHNSVDTPALLPDGTPSELSVSRVLRARGQERSPAGLSAPVRSITDDIAGHRGLTGTGAPDDERVDATGRAVEETAIEEGHDR
jgi:NADH-quinone oxidoreductase subunit J